MLINTNTSELRALISLDRTNRDIAVILERLSTGMKINSAKDDPSGIVARDQLRAEIKGIDAALRNTDRADSVLSSAGTGIQNIANQLIDLRGLLNSDTTTQTEIDALLDSIDYIARSTTYNGKSVINGALDYITNGVDQKKVSQLHITSADLSRGTIPVSIQVKQAAERASLALNQAGVGSTTQLTVRGSLGSETLTLTPSMSTAQIVANVNALSSATGVRAKADYGSVNEQLQIASAGTNNDIILKAVSGSESNVVKLSAAPSGATSPSVDFSTPETVNILLPVETDAPAAATTDAATLGVYAKQFMFGPTGGDVLAVQSNSGVQINSVTFDDSGTSGVSVSLDGSGNLTIQYEAGTTTGNQLAAAINTGNLGLQAVNSSNVTATQAGAAALADPLANNGIKITSTQPGATANGTQIVYLYDPNLQTSFEFASSARQASADFSDGGGQFLTFSASDGGSANNGVVVQFTQASNPLSAGFDSGTRTLTLSGDFLSETLTDADLNNVLSGVDIGNGARLSASGTLWSGLDGLSETLGATAETHGTDAPTLIVSVSSLTTSANDVVTAFGSQGSGLPFTMELAGDGTGTIFTGVDGFSDIATRVYSGANALQGGVDGSAPTTTAAELVDYINNSTELQSYFTASLAPGQTGTGKVSLFDSVADYGDPLKGTGLQFTGSSGGAAQSIVLGTSGANQSLAATLDGSTLRIRLATNERGSVTTTAGDLEEFFSTLTPSQTGGVGVSVLRPVGETYDPPNPPGDAGSGVLSVTSSPITLSPTTKEVGLHTFGNTKIVFESVEAGSDQFVSLSSDLSLPFVDKNGFPATKSVGKDIVANVNGMYASAKGSNLTFNGPTFSLTTTLSDSVKSGDTVSFQITGGGAAFQLGPNVVSSQQLKVGIPSMNSWSLGGVSGRLGELRSGGKADLATDRELSYQILNEAMSDLESTQARIGTIQKETIDVNRSNLQDQLLIRVGAEEELSNANFAEETSKLTRQQIIAQSAFNVILLARQYSKYALNFF